MPWPQVQSLLRLFLDEAEDAPTATALQARPPTLPPLVEEDETAARMQQAHQCARAIAAHAGAREAATVWRCVCGHDAVNWDPCPGCGADVPRKAIRAAIAGVRPVLDVCADFGGAEQPFRRLHLDLSRIRLHLDTLKSYLS